MFKYLSIISGAGLKVTVKGSVANKTMLIDNRDGTFSVGELKFNADEVADIARDYDDIQIIMKAK